MVPFEKQKRFRINPVEIAIFTVISLIFVKSGYSLLSSRHGFEPQVLTASAQDPLSDPVTADSRSPASVGPVAPVGKAFAQITLGCDPSRPAPTVSASKIRFIGNICNGASVGAPEEAAQNVTKIDVTNASDKVVATVFPDYANLRYSTDYISLAQGKNAIRVDYEFKDGKVLGQEFEITRN